MTKVILLSVCLALSIIWLISDPHWEAGIVAILSLLSLSGSICYNKWKLDGKIIVDDVIVDDYPPSIDFRVRNTASRSIGITRILFKIIAIWDGPSPIGHQEVSDEAELSLSANIQVGDVLFVPISVRVTAGDTDRFLINLKWTGDTPDVGKFYRIIPALKTSAGHVQCQPITVHIQEDFKKSSHRYNNPNFILTSGFSVDEKSIPSINWKKEEMSAKRNIAND